MNILNRSALKTKDGLPYFEISKIASMGWLQHGFLTRQGGVSPPPYHSLNLSEDNGDRLEYVHLNKQRISTTFGFDLNDLILLNQIHQDKILVLKNYLFARPSLLEYDAVISNQPNIFLGILTADCVPIFVVDQKRKVIAAVHAGRQGTALHITAKVIEKMKEVFGCSSKDFCIAMGPTIGPCCYEIDKKVFQPEWEPFSIAKGIGKWMIDLAQINIAQMKEGGIEEEQISRIDLCTHCHNDLFFSYRKEGQTGRQLSFIGMME